MLAEHGIPPIPDAPPEPLCSLQGQEPVQGYSGGRALVSARRGHEGDRNKGGRGRRQGQQNLCCKEGAELALHPVHPRMERGPLGEAQSSQDATASL